MSDHLNALLQAAKARNWDRYHRLQEATQEEINAEDERLQYQVFIPGRLATEAERAECKQAVQFAAYCESRGMAAKIGYAVAVGPAHAKKSSKVLEQVFTKQSYSERLWVDAQYGSQMRVTATWTWNGVGEKKYKPEGVVLKAEGIGRVDMTVTEFKKMGGK